MASPLNITRIPAPRVAFLDERTGQITREWYRFLYNLFILTGSGSNAVSLDELQIGPPNTTVDEITVNIDKNTNVESNTESLVSQIAELQKQLDGLKMQVQPELGTMSQLQQANLPWVTYDTTPEHVPPDIGTVAWDGGTTLGVQMTANVLGQVNESAYYYVKASSAITKGEVVMFTGAVGASGVPTGAPATGVTDGSYIMGIAAESIALNGFGLVQYQGTLKGLNTSAYVDGDILWYNPAVTGGLTKTKPSAPNIKVQMAAVINAGSGGSGSILIRVTPGSELGGTDSNVQFGTLATNDLIQYNGTYWTNVTPASVIAGAGGAPVTKTADFTVGASDTWIINNKSGSTCTVTLPTASSYTGRVLTFQNYQAQTLVSASSNVVPLGGGSAGTAILDAVAGNWATLVSDGTNWVMMQEAPNNVMLV